MTAAERSETLEGFEDLARKTLSRIERRRFELLGLTIFVIVAFALGIAAVSFERELSFLGDSSAANVLRVSLIPLALGFAAYLIEKERQLRKLTREVHELERQASGRLRLLFDMKDTLLTAVSHEVRTPLTKALGAVRLLHERGAEMDPGQVANLVRTSRDGLESLERLLGDLLDVDRLYRDVVDLNRSEVDMGELVREAVSSFNFGDERALEVEAEPVVVHVDPPKVERIVEALLANAKRHTPANTPVWVKVRRDRNGVAIVVEDAGPGIPEAYRESVFRPLRHGPDPSAHSPGTGLGLTIVERLAALHGGRVWVQERPGGGASVGVYLPDGWEATGDEVERLSKALGVSRP
jgi:signal transduction histidine kinase